MIIITIIIDFNMIMIFFSSDFDFFFFLSFSSSVLFELYSYWSISPTRWHVTITSRRI